MHGAWKIRLGLACGALLLIGLVLAARARQPQPQALSSSPKVVKPSLHWMTNLPLAQAKARAEKKLLLLNFTGSDWCGWSLKLRREVFAKPEFIAFARENLVLMEVDFPRAPSEELRQTNAAIARQFQVPTVPKLILLDQEGRRVGAWAYEDGGARHYLAEFKKAIASPVPEKPAAPEASGAASATAPAKPSRTSGTRPASVTKKSAPRASINQARPRA